jgi:hypothetical protein
MAAANSKVSSTTKKGDTGYWRNADNNHWVHFLNIFLFLAGPEGLERKNFKIETQSIKI